MGYFATEIPEPGDEIFCSSTSTTGSARNWPYPMDSCPPKAPAGDGKLKAQHLSGAERTVRSDASSAGIHGRATGVLGRINSRGANHGKITVTPLGLQSIQNSHRGHLLSRALGGEKSSWECNALDGTMNRRWKATCERTVRNKVALSVTACFAIQPEYNINLKCGDKVCLKYWILQ